jgi:monoamine oxidase
VVFLGEGKGEGEGEVSVVGVGRGSRVGGGVVLNVCRVNLSKNRLETKRTTINTTTANILLRTVPPKIRDFAEFPMKSYYRKVFPMKELLCCIKLMGI